MTANLYEKNNRYHVMLSWTQDKKRKQKSVATGISTNGNNKRKAEIKKNEVLKDWEEKVTDSYQDILFSDYLKIWLDTIKHSIAETTYYEYKSSIEKQICPYFAERKIKLHELEPHHIQRFYNWKLETSEKAGKKLSGNTIRHYQANIHAALKFAVKQKYIRENPANAEKLSLPKKKKHIPDFYTEEELLVLLEVIRGDKIETPVFLASWFGLRRGEILGLRWQDVNFNEKTISINGTVTDKGKGTIGENLMYREGVAKTEASLRTFILPAKVSNYLQALKSKQAELRRLLGTSYCTKWNDFICVDDMGELIRPNRLSNAFPVLLKKYGLRKIKLHELRDSNASLLLAKGVDMKVLQEWLGHEHYSTTAGYAHLRSDAKYGLADVLNKALAPAC